VVLREGDSNFTGHPGVDIGETVAMGTYLFGLWGAVQDGLVGIEFVCLGAWDKCR
jgi:hypothetical protein